MFPVQIEEAVRALAGDEFEIVLSTGDSGLDIMTVRANMAIAPATAAFWRGSLKSEIRRAAKVAYRSTFLHQARFQRPSLRRSGLRSVANSSQRQRNTCRDADVAFWHKVDMNTLLSNFGFRGRSGRLTG
jgi:hypothetical protein